MTNENTWNFRATMIAVALAYETINAQIRAPSVSSTLSFRGCQGRLFHGRFANDSGSFAYRSRPRDCSGAMLNDYRAIKAPHRALSETGALSRTQDVTLTANWPKLREDGNRAARRFVRNSGGRRRHKGF